MQRFASSWIVQPTLWPTIGAIYKSPHLAWPYSSGHSNDPMANRDTTTTTTDRVSILSGKPEVFFYLPICQEGWQKKKRTGFWTSQMTYCNDGRVGWAFRSQPTTHNQTISNQHKLFNPPNFSDFPSLFQVSGSRASSWLNLGAHVHRLHCGCSCMSGQVVPSDKTQYLSVYHFLVSL